MVCLRCNGVDDAGSTRRGGRIPLETYAGWRGVLPLTVALLIEKRTMLIVGAESASIRPSGRLSAARRPAIAQAEERHGRRIDRGRRCLRLILARTAEACATLPRVVVEIDGKTLYASLLHQVFGRSRLVQVAQPRTKSRPSARRRSAVSDQPGLHLGTPRLRPHDTVSRGW